MTTEQIFNCRDLDFLYSMWLNPKTPDNEKIDCASIIDRIEAFKRQKAKEAFDINQVPIIKNNNYKDIIER